MRKNMITTNFLISLALAACTIDARDVPEEFTISFRGPEAAKAVSLFSNLSGTKAIEQAPAVAGNSRTWKGALDLDRLRSGGSCEKFVDKPCGYVLRFDFDLKPYASVTVDANGDFARTGTVSVTGPVPTELVPVRYDGGEAVLHLRWKER